MESLQEDEQIIVQDTGKSDFFGKGTLYLTTRRLVFEVGEGGLLSRSTETRIDQPVESISSFSAAGRRILVVHFEGNMEPSTLHIDNPEKWETAIRSVMVMSGGT
ncbi:MAG TPA: hypothetical protein HA263_11725 [Methanoregulaceae archaeon]|nr:hypothetical protein [Methanoregulaceae archaeon]